MGQAGAKLGRSMPGRVGQYFKLQRHLQLVNERRSAAEAKLAGLKGSISAHNAALEQQHTDAFKYSEDARNALEKKLDARRESILAELARHGEAAQQAAVMDVADVGGETFTKRRRRTKDGGDA